jgi:signal transduction histidine kinase
MTKSLEWLAARGALAAGVARELARPLDEVYAKLAATVEELDQHVRSARGPEPLPWQMVGAVRERVAEVFLEIGRARDLAANLALVAAPASDEPSAVDLNELVEQALSLARHRFAKDGDALLDLGSLPPVRAVPARLGQAVALLLVHAAECAGPTGTVSVRTEATPAEVVLSVGVSASGAPLHYAEAIGAAVAADGGRLELGGPELQITLALPRSDVLR